jgi:hypothetical protein
LSSRVEEALRTTVRQIAARAAEYVARDRERERLMPRTITDPAPWSVS